MRRPSLRALNWPAVARAAVGLSAAAAIVAAGAWLSLSAARSSLGELAHAAAKVDPLAVALKRCQIVAEAGKDDAGCEAAWEENRRRFFTYGPGPQPYVRGR
jgi:conjugative transfer region protein TrbK